MCGAGGFFVWCLPAAILVATSVWSIPYRKVIWPVVLTEMGVACLVNARRCGRVHCYWTGPFFLGLASVSALYGFGVLDLGRRGWQDLTAVLLVGSILFGCVPEWIWGRYRRQSQRS